MNQKTKTLSSKETPQGCGRTYPLDNINNVLKVDPKELAEKLAKNIRKQSKKPISRHRRQRTRKRHNTPKNNRKGSIFNNLGIDDIRPQVEPRRYILVGKTGSKEAHFVRA